MGCAAVDMSVELIRVNLVNADEYANSSVTRVTRGSMSKLYLYREVSNAIEIARQCAVGNVDVFRYSGKDTADGCTLEK